MTIFFAGAVGSLKTFFIISCDHVGHIGNARLRKLALERKVQFDAGNYTEKRALATEIVQHIRSLDPPGRFLRRANDFKPPKNESENLMLPSRGLEGEWEELNDEKAIHKACQVMRDIDRPDRKDREVRKRKKTKPSTGEEGSIKSETESAVKAFPETDANTTEKAWKEESAEDGNATEAAADGGNNAAANESEDAQASANVTTEADSTVEKLAEPKDTEDPNGRVKVEAPLEIAETAMV